MTLTKQPNQSITAEVSLIDEETGRSFNVNVVITGATESQVRKHIKVIQHGILETAGRNYAKNDDRIFIKRENGSFNFHWRPTQKAFSSGTLGMSLLKICKWVEAHSTYKSNDLFRLLMTTKSRLNADFCASVLGKMDSLVPGGNLIQMTNIPKPFRFSGKCYKNAWDEFKSTGNEPVIVMEACLSQGGLAIVVPHAINYDASTKVYYDTEYGSTIRSDLRAAWIIKRGKPLMEWYDAWHEDWETAEQFAHTYGSYNLLWIDDKLITIHTTGIDCDRIGEVNTLKGVQVEDLEPWAVKGREFSD
jgi:hypothetical protein